MLHENVLHSRLDKSLSLLNKAWKEGLDAIEILESLHPISLFTYSFEFPTIHVPKEHEYLLRFLNQVPEREQIDFLKRFLEYLIWSPKYVIDKTDSYPSGLETVEDIKEEYLSSMEDHKGPAALSSVITLTENRGLEESLRVILQVGCNDISQVIGHYFSCTESIIRLASNAEMPAAKNHLFLLTLYLMQSSPIILRDYRRPSKTLDEILTKLVKKGNFAGYHYMILANGLIKNRKFIGEKHYLHALHGIETLLPHMTDTISLEKLDSMTQDRPRSKDHLNNLKKYVWKGEKKKALSTMREYLEKEGVTKALENTLAHTYTKIDRYPHDPHYVTFPVSAFELVPHLKDEAVSLILSHTIEFAVNRIERHGVIS
jgi:hypothetical protein